MNGQWTRREAIGTFLATLLANGVRADDVPAFGGISCLEELEGMSWPALEATYRAATAGDPPCGDFRGSALYCLGKKGGKFRRESSQLLWVGKRFEGGCMVNRWRAGTAVRAAVSVGPSWLDGAPSVLMDYRGESAVVWRNIRDEIRPVGPGVYLGMMIRYQDCRGTFVTWFGLQAECCG